MAKGAPINPNRISKNNAPIATLKIAVSSSKKRAPKIYPVAVMYTMLAKAPIKVEWIKAKFKDTSKTAISETAENFHLKKLCLFILILLHHTLGKLCLLRYDNIFVRQLIMI